MWSDRFQSVPVDQQQGRITSFILDIIPSKWVFQTIEKIGFASHTKLAAEATQEFKIIYNLEF